MATALDGPHLVLDGVDCSHLAVPLARYLVAQSRRDGGVPPRLRELADNIARTARSWQTEQRAGSDIGTPGFRDDAPGAPCVSSAPRLTAEEAADLLRCSPGYVRRLCRQGTLPGVRTAGKGAWLVDETAVLERLGATA